MFLPFRREINVVDGVALCISDRAEEPNASSDAANDFVFHVLGYLLKSKNNEVFQQAHLYFC
jgi:hypothetical protein